MSCFDDGNCNAVQIEYDGNGSLTKFTFPFPYEDQGEVHVEKWDAINFRYNRIDRDQWSFDNLTTIKFVTAPDYTFRIMRETDLKEIEVTFYPGSSIRAQDLNANFEQLLHAIQEGWCRVSDEFYCYLDEFIFDKRDAWTKEEQQNNQVVPEGDKIFLDDAITARTDTYLQDATPIQPPYEQGGKRWYDTNIPNNYIWNDDIEAWVDYSRTGPQGPKGEDGHHTVIMGLKAPTARPSGDPIQSGDIWYNTCTGETWIYYSRDKDDPGTWQSFGTGGIVGPQGPTGNYQAIVSTEAPTVRPSGSPLENGDIWFNTCIGEAFWYFNNQWINFTANGTKGDTGFYKTLVSFKPPKYRDEKGTPLQEGDIWFNTCTGEAFIWYDCQWVTFGDGAPPTEGGQSEGRMVVGNVPITIDDTLPDRYVVNITSATDNTPVAADNDYAVLNKTHYTTLDTRIDNVLDISGLPDLP